jgi:hypothetical protein
VDLYLIVLSAMVALGAGVFLAIQRDIPAW